ncbi:MAG: 2-keto-4-pentenoate hydratase [Cyclobacteriaceae bacterium]
MIKLTVSILVFFTLIPSFGETPPKEIKHKFIAVDNLSRHVFLIDQFDKSNNWKVDVPPQPRDLFIINNSKFMISYSKGYQIRSMQNGELIHNFSGASNVQSAQIINEKTLLASNTEEGIKLSFYGKDDTFEKEVVLHGYRNVRLVRKQGKSFYLSGSKEKKFFLLELNSKLEIKKTIPLNGKGYLFLKNIKGNILLSNGAKCEILEINEDGKTIKTYGGKSNFTELKLNWFSGFQVSENGLIAANWLGHGKKGTSSHLYEFNEQNEVVWRWEDHDKANAITNFVLLDNFFEVNNILNSKIKEKSLSPLTGGLGRFDMKRAYHIHDQFLTERMNYLSENAYLAGYKIAYASKASQERWGMTEPVYGGFLNTQLLDQSSKIDFDKYIQFHIETEVAVHINKDIEEEIMSMDDLKGYIDTIYLSFDIPDNIFDSKTYPEDIAASASGAKYFVLGKGIAVNESHFKTNSFTIRQTFNEELVYEGPSNSVMGHPFNSVLWLSKKLQERGQFLKEGQIIVTGAVSKAFVPSKKQKKGKHTGMANGFNPVIIYTK